MPVSVKAKPIHPYATHIPGRRPSFKTHATLGQAKNALSLYLEQDLKPGPYGVSYRHGDDGVYTASMTVYRLDPERDEYEPWIEIRQGDRRSSHPELMPARMRAAYEPSDDQQRATSIAIVQGLHWDCLCPRPGDPHKPWCLGLAKNDLLNRLNGADQ